PLLSFLLPRWTIGLPMPASLNPSPAGEPLVAAPLPARDAPTPSPQASTSAAPAASPAVAPTRPSGRADAGLRVLIAVWLAGVLVVCGRMLHAFRGLRRLQR